jgi:hypothetical protein
MVYLFGYRWLPQQSLSKPKWNLGKMEASNIKEGKSLQSVFLKTSPISFRSAFF